MSDFHMDFIHTTQHRGPIVFRLNEVVRKIVQQRLRELEDPIVSFAIESIRNVLQDYELVPRGEEPAPFPVGNDTRLGDIGAVFSDTADETRRAMFLHEELPQHPVFPSTPEFVAVPTTISGKEYFVILDDEYKILVNMVIDTTGDKCVGTEVQGVLDTEGVMWEVVRETDGCICQYKSTTTGKCVGVHSVVREHGTYTLPDWTTLEQNNKTS